MKTLVFEINNKIYDGCNSVTVGELIKFLQKYDKDEQVCIDNDCHGVEIIDGVFEYEYKEK